MADNPYPDRLRWHRSPLEIDLIDELRAATMSRRAFLRAASVVGLGLPLAGAFAGPSLASAAPIPRTAKRLATLRIGVAAPTDRLDPLSLDSDGAVAILGQSAEYLTWSNDRLQLEPRLGTSWKPNADASQWTFAVRKGVRFHNGKGLTADDIVATFDRLTDPANSSTALSVFGGVLAKGNTTKVDSYTVSFELNVPYANFPYLVSSDNVNAVILPKNYAGDWEKTFVGTGPWIRQEYRAGLSVTYKRNAGYWDRARIPRFETLVLSLLGDEGAAVQQLQAGQIDAIAKVGVAGAQLLAADPAVVVQSIRTSSHRQIHLRNDGVFADKRVRQALALTLDRDSTVAAMTAGRGDLGNDSPFAPVFAATDASVPQRRADLDRARQLMKDAGVADGFEVQLDLWPGLDVAALAGRVQSSAKQIGIVVQPNLTADYYTKAWLDSAMGITDYRHRGVPNFFLWAPLRSDGAWNAAHYRSPMYDVLVAQYNAALDVASQKAAARRVEELLLDDTPIVIPYFANHNAASKRSLVGLRITGAGHVDAASATTG